jgi:hypothetical protein
MFKICRESNTKYVSSILINNTSNYPFKVNEDEINISTGLSTADFAKLKFQGALNRKWSELYKVQ